MTTQRGDGPDRGAWWTMWKRLPAEGRKPEPYDMLWCLREQEESMSSQRQAPLGSQ